MLGSLKKSGAAKLRHNKLQMKQHIPVFISQACPIKRHVWHSHNLFPYKSCKKKPYHKK